MLEGEEREEGVDLRNGERENAKLMLTLPLS